MLSRLDLAGAGYTFLTFRSLGATFAFNNNLKLQNIQKTWHLDVGLCVYITDSIDAGDQVAQVFVEKLSVS